MENLYNSKITAEDYYGDGFSGQIASSVLKRKYLKDGEDLADLWYRVAREAAKVEEAPDYWTSVFYNDLLKGWNFVPGGRILYSLGRKNVSPVNCFVIPIKEDSIDGIFKYAYEEAVTYIWQGGVGTDISILRPSGAPLRSRDGATPGIIPFMDLYSKITLTISQNGRRGALMITIRDWHPDLLLFIDAKKDAIGEWFEKLNEVIADLKRFNDNPEIRAIANSLEELEKIYRWQVDPYRQIAGANISVILSKEFMEAVKRDEEWELIFPDYERYPAEYDQYWDGNIRKWIDRFGRGAVKVYRKVRAREVFSKIAESAHKSGEPGVIFEENILKDWIIDANFLATNPCGEIPLSPYEPCVLGHIVLSRFVKDYPWGLKASERYWGEFPTQVFSKKEDLPHVLDRIDFYNLRRVARLGVRFLDNIVSIALNSVPLKEQAEALKKYRRIGMGITGFAEMLLMLGVPYDSELSVELARVIMRTIASEAVDQSIKLGQEKGVYPGYEEERSSGFFKRLGYDTAPPRRNAFMLTIAPVGTGGIITQTMGGIEPIYFPYMTRRVRFDGEDREFVVVPSIIEYFYGKPFSTVEEVKEFLNERFPKDLQRWALKINPIDRVRVQGAFQEYVDNSISSTVNLRKNVSPRLVEEIYESAYEYGCKGITIYREGSRGDVLVAGDEDEEETRSESPRIPEIKGESKETTFNLIEPSQGHRSQESEASNLVAVSLESPTPVIGAPVEKLVNSTTRNLSPVTQDKSRCPVCGDSLVFSGGCTTCPSCGYSKCSL